MIIDLIHLPRVSEKTYDRNAMFLNNSVQKCFSSEKVTNCKEGLIKSFLSLISSQYLQELLSQERYAETQLLFKEQNLNISLDILVYLGKSLKQVCK